MLKLLGWFFLATPLILVFILVGKTVGWVRTMVLFGIAAFIVAMLFVGATLISGG